MFRALYEISDGGSYLNGNLMLNKLRGSSSFEGVATLTEDVRDAGTPIPSELVIFGSDGSDNVILVPTAGCGPHTGRRWSVLMIRTPCCFVYR